MFDVDSVRILIKNTPPKRGVDGHATKIEMFNRLDKPEGLFVQVGCFGFDHRAGEVIRSHFEAEANIACIFCTDGDAP